ncbi:MAG: AAA family ATPase [Chromatiales bacterium]|nr:AAA family ATPase [Chromatiales bacterium]
MTQQPRIVTLRERLSSEIVGQTALLDRLVIGLLTRGHILVEGLPGLAKTTAVKTLASAITAEFCRVQFTPDLLPADLTGGEIYDPGSGHVEFRAGPLFHEILLADEINRAPAKVQSALLEAMQEHQVTAGGATHRLPDLFMVMATQNPIEQAGTYPLPEAQLDRFLLHVRIDYPDAGDELEILRRGRASFAKPATGMPAVIGVESVLAARAEVAAVHIEPALEQYIVTLTRATRAPGRSVPALSDSVEVGASPRAALALAQAALAMAYLRGRDYVIPDDIIDLAPDALRHRVIPSMSARMAGLDADAIVAQLLEVIEVP